MNATAAVSSPPKPKRRRFQFSLGTLLLVVTAIAVVLGIQVNRVDRQRKAVAAIEELGGRVSYDYQMNRRGMPERSGDSEPSAPKWLRQMVGDDYFRTVTAVLCQGSVKARVVSDRLITVCGELRLRPEPARITDGDLGQLEAFPDLHTLSLTKTEITDKGLDHLNGLAQLRELHLGTTRITDDGLARLCNLPLEDLDLSTTLVTDAGLAHLQSMKSLKTLDLSDTRVTDAGVAQLRKALPQAKIIAPRRRVREIEYHLKQAVRRQRD